MARPLLRVLAHHAQLSAVMQAREPADQAARPRVWVGEPGHPADRLAYQAPPLGPSLRYNYVTAAAALPVLRALLPGGGSAALVDAVAGRPARRLPDRGSERRPIR